MQGCFLGASSDSFPMHRSISQGPYSAVPTPPTLCRQGKLLTYMVLIASDISCLQTCLHMNFNFLFKVIYRKCYKVPPNLFPQEYVLKLFFKKKRQALKVCVASAGTPAGLLSCNSAGSLVPGMNVAQGSRTTVSSRRSMVHTASHRRQAVPDPSLVGFAAFFSQESLRDGSNRSCSNLSQFSPSLSPQAPLSA